MAKTRRPLKPRGRTEYDNDLHLRGDQWLVPDDDHTLNQALCRARMVRPDYKKGPTIFRPWPNISYDDPKVLARGRKSGEDGEGGFTDWIVRVPCVRFAGLNMKSCPNATYIPHWPWDKSMSNTHPQAVFFSACEGAFKSASFGPGRKWDPEWNKLMGGGEGRGAEISRSGHAYFCQGEVYMRGDRCYIEDRDGVPLGAAGDDDLIVLELSISVGISMIELMNRTKESDETKFLYGDPVGRFDPNSGVVKGGVFFIVFNPRVTTRFKKNTTWDGKKPKSSDHGYEVAVAPAYTAEDINFKPGLSAAQVENVFNRFQFWFDDPNSDAKGILRVPEIEEQCMHLARGYKAVPKLLRFAWADNPEFLTSDVKGILNERRSSVMPGDDEETETEATRERDPTQGDEEFFDDEPEPREWAVDDRVTTEINGETYAGVILKTKDDQTLVMFDDGEKLKVAMKDLVLEGSDEFTGEAEDEFGDDAPDESEAGDGDGFDEEETVEKHPDDVDEDEQFFAGDEEESEEEAAAAEPADDTFEEDESTEEVEPDPDEGFGDDEDDKTAEMEDSMKAAQQRSAGRKSVKKAAKKTAKKAPAKKAGKATGKKTGKAAGKKTGKAAGKKTGKTGKKKR